MHLTFREKYEVFKKTKRTIMEMVQATILKKYIDNILLHEILQIMTLIKNLRPTQAVKDSIISIEI